ncbi:MAG: tRNA uridine(34) 5-carboxymethylaminomethyl modification radical SAM/GNAT enzyme Elp3 [Candidatus Magasanikbacteria bacterium CG10_big_fil_rev_8_21_14_0_10_42_10]|uniref:tRNA carboxymethyluridine synthase n=1 Tax=Candidatus Magasanikbacteria bacterium CG10_big_fil_rev_8_21_14_0_10_42_10 TaxID=1974649 RepID=A0A2H0TW46_9BACT|nr:MAG: tRNA uridine(34) 5-carboxymethylaminomethyl modification radical SAM/GNAT enzyme Elp3 [Candidatus Magasanikbacteria bacterium CG10_big_fil_rev_8_21_14_0_10_42_10]
MSEQLETILQKIIASSPTTKEQFDSVRRKTCNALKIKQPSNKLLSETYQKMVENGSIPADKQFETLMRKADIRSMSGIAVITSLVKPYMCPGTCVYCPTEYRMPKSYIASEPAAARSQRLNFDPYQLMQKRIEMLESNGHPCDKIEYIIKGGTWNAYPLKYQYWYILESFKACNNFSREVEVPSTEEDDWREKKLEDIQAALEEEQTYNETADYRIIGLTLETRPDAISPKTIHHMRRQGCTRIELGLQAPDDKILELIQRGHSVQQFRDAITLLRQAGFKVDLHFMPDLPGSSPEHDIEMYKTLFTDLALRPDMVKIYPCAVIKSAELYQWLQDGRYTPYGEEGLFRALLQMKLETPRYCRISRLIRDIPSEEIEAGNKITNLREELEKELHKRGQVCVCLRCREIGRQQKLMSAEQLLADPEIVVETYETIGGTEYFITMEDAGHQAVYGFLRLRLPEKIGEKNEKLFEYMPEIRDVAFIRELHTYGQLVGIGKTEEGASQHTGLGSLLMKEAERIAKEQGYHKVAVISGVGVRGYYEKKHGYVKEGTYMVKKLT